MRVGDAIILESKGIRRQASCIKIWRRSEGHQTVMSISSGPKGMLINSIVTVFVGLFCKSQAAWTDSFANPIGVQPV